MKRWYRFQINLLFEKCANFFSFEFMECLLSIKYVKLALIMISQWTLDNQQRKNSSGTIFARKSFVCVVTNALPGLQKRVVKRDFFSKVYFWY